MITADEGLRAGKAVKLKHNTDEALTKSLGEEKVIVIRRTGGSCAMHAGRDFWYHELAANVGTECPPRRWALKIHSSSFIPLARQARQRVWCTPQAAISSMPP